MLEKLEKLGGIVTIVVAFTVLYLISVFEPPTFVQIICAFAGSFVCLIGIVFLFAEGSILEARREMKASKVK
jgi:hypothetical protein